MKIVPEAFHFFNHTIPEVSLPEKFTYPFCYDPHLLAKQAALEVQDFLKFHYDNEHNFGLDPEHPGLVIGKMFGVLVVKTLSGDLGFLAAYSGKLAQGKQHSYFVPPVYDVFEENGMYLTKVKEVVALNEQIETLEQDESFRELKEDLRVINEKASAEIAELKARVKAWKKERQQKRLHAEAELSPEDFKLLLQRHTNESLKQQFDLKVLVKHWQKKLEEVEVRVNEFHLHLELLREERRNCSARLQQLLFENYKFLNAKQESKSLLAIFTQELNVVPPAGAGECAAPKLLQYAYLNHLQPVAIAEFWWGQSPKSEIRKHGDFYPACRGKCGPILGFMMEGLEVDKNPLEENPAAGKELAVVFEDEDIIVINKPAEFLSVPGKFVVDSVQTRIQKEHPDAVLVHRLDQSTSGIILVAKNYESYVHLQKQFLKRTVVKRYLAVLKGLPEKDQGLIDLPLRVDLDNRPYQMVCYEHGKPAQTKFEVQKRENGLTYIHFYPITGRTHQLRMHASHPLGLNTPILGDDLYGTKSDRLYLHAEYLEFDHPKTKERLKFNVPAEFSLANSFSSSIST